MSKVNIVNVGYDSTNYYLIARDKATLLVDVGFADTLPKLQAECKRMSVDLKSIHYLFCTHFHPDHAGLAEELKAMGTKLIVTDNQRAFLEANALAPHSGIIQIELDNNLVVPLEDSRAYLQRIGFEGQFVSTPGHSDDSVTLVLDDGSAFTGDLGHPMLVGDETDNSIYQSWTKLRALDVKTVYPGHGPSWPIGQFFKE
jgi:ribonuclease/clavin/mitogillin